MAFAFLLAAAIFEIASSTTCDSFYECYQHNIADKAKCFGFASCSEAKFTSKEEVYCDGDRSCFQARMDVTECVKCRSAAACDSATIRTSDVVHCEGSHSCATSEIVANAARFYGFYSGAMSSVSDTKFVSAHGFYSFLYGTVDSGRSKSLQVEMDGLKAGYGASVVCRGGSTCKLMCNGNGCENVNYYCYNNADCSVVPSACVVGDMNTVGSVEGTICPHVQWSKSLNEDRAMDHSLENKFHGLGNDETYNQWLGLYNEDAGLWRQREEEYTPFGSASKEGNARISAVKGPMVLSRHLESGMQAAVVILVVVLLFIPAIRFMRCTGCQKLGKCEEKVNATYQSV